MREWLASIVGESLAPILTVILAATLVVILALVLIGLAKRVFAGSGGIGGRSRAPRLAVLDMAPVDPKRKLVLVRRDDVEHLILIGGQNDIVVEPGIVRGQARRPRQEPGFADAEPRAAAPQPQQQPLPHRRIPRPSVQPLPDDGQAPGEHPAIAPVVESRFDALAEHASRAPSVVPDRSLPSENRAPAITAPPGAVAPPVAAPVAAPQRPVEEPVAPRRAEPGFAPEPPLRRTAEPVSEAAPVIPPAPRPAPAVAIAEPAPRPSEPVQAPIVERREPPMRPPEPARPVTPPAPPVAQLPVVPPVAPPVAPPAAAPAPQVAAPQPAAIIPPAPPRPAAPPVPPQPAAAPVAAAAPQTPRSMATPTLPQLPRATPVAPPQTPGQVRTEPTVIPARSLWSTAPSVTVTPIAEPKAEDRPESPARDPFEPSAPTSAAPQPERAPVRWPPAPVAPRQDETARAEVGFAGPRSEPEDPAPAPLSVRSFATTIQERRTSMPSEAASPAPSAPAPNPVAAHSPVQPARVMPAPQTEPTASIPAPITPAVLPDADLAADRDAEGNRPLTLEEEMERLLHDFTIDVSERR